MRSFDLRTDGASREATLREITGGPAGVRTTCTLTRSGGNLRVSVEGEDPEMADLRSSVSPPGEDRFLYEEDRRRRKQANRREKLSLPLAFRQHSGV